MRAQHGLVAAVLSALVLLVVAPLAPAATAGDAPLEVENALLTWGLNDESNNKAFAPGTFNFLSAGTVPDPGRGGQNIVAPGVWRGTDTRAWRAVSGRVSVEKQRPDGTYARATFAGLGTAVDGSPLTGTTGPFSQHRVVLSGGTGTVDPGSGTARIDWKGSFSVVSYSGFSFFTVSKISLGVTGGVAQVHATLSGYAADRTDPKVWGAVAPRRVVLAELPMSGIDLSAKDGFSVQPAYSGVGYNAPGSAPAQVRSGAAWGAFPATFLDYLERLGSAAFWYSSGGAADSFKVPKPVTISYDASAPVEVPTTPTGPTTPSPSPQPTTPVNPEPPTPTAPVVPAPTPVPTQPAGPTLPDQPPAVAPPAAAPQVDSAVDLPRPTTVTAVAARTSSPMTPAGTDSDPTWTWWLGSALLLGAAALTLLSTRAKGNT